MANIILVIGESGSGKTTSTENLNPLETFFIRIADKDLSYGGWVLGCWRSSTSYWITDIKLISD